MKRILVLFIFSNFFISQNKITYIVEPQETLFAIAARNYTTIEELMSLNPELKSGLKIGQKLSIPLKEKIASDGKTFHEVKPQETLFAIARLYNVSVKDLEELNADLLFNGLKSGQKLAIPIKKKTLSGDSRIINNESQFHLVQPKETKYSIAKQYNISIQQLEAHNPEIINGLKEGSKLVINKKLVYPKSENDQLMLALAEKQVLLEKNKLLQSEVEDLQDKLVVQKQINQKTLNLNALNINLEKVNESESGSIQRLKLILEANKNIQDILRNKLDSLIVDMNNDIQNIKKKEFNDEEESKEFEKLSYKSIYESNLMIQELKRDLYDNKKVYSDLMYKVQRINHQKSIEIKKKMREGINSKADDENLVQIEKLNKQLVSEEVGNDELLKIADQLSLERDYVVRKKIAKAQIYSESARDYDDKLAIQKLRRYSNKVAEENKMNANFVKYRKPDANEIKSQSHLYDSINEVKVSTDINYTKSLDGYYLVLKTFENPEERDVFAKLAIDKGFVFTNILYNPTIYKYLVFIDYFNNIHDATYVLKKYNKEQLFKDAHIVNLKKKE